LVNYSFDDGLVDTGPATVRVFQQAKGRVSLSRRYRWSGQYAVEIEDVPGDGDFPELQGYFPQRGAGVLYLHFAFMTTDPHEELNIALAGSAGFALAKHGLGLWLLTQDGLLRHVSDSIPKKLFRVQPFVFYLVDVAYDIDQGTYDLRIAEESSQHALVDLTAQANATASPASNVSTFSFIGDRGTDTSHAHYFVDDVIVSTDREVTQFPFQAPGRRKLFIDAWQDKLASSEQTRCPRLERPDDFGVASSNLSLSGEALGALPAGAIQSLQSAPDGAALVRSIEAWQAGCRALDGGDAKGALASFDLGLAARARAPLLDLSRALALAKLERWQEAELTLSRTSRAFIGDPRWEIVAASVNFLHGDLEHAEEALARAVSRTDDAANASESAATAARRYLLLLLWNGKPDQAIRVCERLVANRRAAKQPAAEWLELLADALFYADHPRRAAATYLEAMAGHPDPARLDEKLSDVYFKLGNLSKERHHRERVWGALK
jgi:tetratricopeptide (TPR) repeat protein